VISLPLWQYINASAIPDCWSARLHVRLVDAHDLSKPPAGRKQQDIHQ
jgi:hypothetical protein